MTIPRHRAGLRPRLSALFLLAAVALIASALLGSGILPTEAAIPGVQPRTSLETIGIGPYYQPSMFKRGSTIYMAGGFESVDRWITGPLALVNPDTGLLLERMPMLDGIVRTVLEDGAGGWFVGGSFHAPSAPSLQNLIHIRADRTLDLTWQPPVPYITQLARSGSTLYYTGLKPEPVNSYDTVVAGSIDIPSGQPTAWHPNATLPTVDDVHHLVVSGATVVFNLTNEQLAVNSTTGQLVWKRDLSIHSMLADGPTLYIGGHLDTLSGVKNQCLGALDIATGKALPLRLTCEVADNTLGTIESMALFGNRLYVQGFIEKIDNQPVRGIMAVELPSGTVTPWSGDNHEIGPYGKLKVFNNRIYLVHMNMAGAVDLASGEMLWKRRTTMLETFEISGQGMLLGGRMAHYEAESFMTDLMRLDTTTGRLEELRIEGPYIGEVTHAVHDSANIYTVTWQPTGQIAMVNAVSFDTGAPSPGGSITANNSVSALAAGPGRLYIAGDFTAIAGQDRPGLAALDLTPNDPSSWGTVASWAPQLPAGSVTSLLAQGGTLYTAVRTAAATTQIIALDTASGAPSGWSATLPADTIASMVISGTTLYASGAFQDQSGSWGISALDLSGQTQPVRLLPNASAGALVLRDTTLSAASAGGVKVLDLTTGAVGDWGGGVSGVTTIADGGDELLVYWCGLPDPWKRPDRLICGLKTFPYASAIAATGSADGLSGTNATLHGSVAPNDSPVNAFFQLTDQPGSCSAVRTVAARPSGEMRAAAAPGSAQAQTVSASLDGLTPGTTYFYRLVVSNPYGVGYGSVERFTAPTEAEAPAAAPAEAPTVVPTAATPPLGTQLFLPWMRSCAEGGF